MYITGIDGYIKAPDLFVPGEYPEYIENYLPDQAKQYRDTALNGKPTGHNNNLDAGIILKLIKSDARCQLDPICFPYVQAMANRK